MKIVTYNVNSLRAREERVLTWLSKHSPDVVCFQELKLEDDKFPEVSFAAHGYKAVTYGQKTYNGVAIVSKYPLENVERGFGDGVDDPQARLIAATTNGVRVISAYMPNGESSSSPKYTYKLEWFARLARWLEPRVAAGKTVLVGDYNVAPADLDVHDPAAWAGSVLCSEPERAAFRTLIDLGLVDTFRHLHPSEKAFTWWDYRMLGFPKNKGLRIDHALVTHDLLSRVSKVWVDREERKGKSPSDHAPLWLELDEPTP